MSKWYKAAFIIIILMMAGNHFLYAQLDFLHGDYTAIASGVVDGNNFRLTIYNDGTFGVKQQPPDIAGEWPINSGHYYLYDGVPCIGAEVVDSNGLIKHIVSEAPGPGIGYSTGDLGPTGEYWTFLPLPGFYNQSHTNIAISTVQSSWPYFWPDKAYDPVDPGWTNSWNGYFGKNIFNANVESYFVADDYENKEFLFYPDSTDLQRRGLGVRMYCRTMQWAAPSVQDVLFTMFDFENIGTYNHDKMVFGYKIGNEIGSSDAGYEGNDDMGAFDLDEDLAYLFDWDDIGAGGWSPVGYFGTALFATPGNRVDGIDNDNDGAGGSGLVIVEEMFSPKTINTGVVIVTINYLTYERTIQTLPAEGINIQYGKTITHINPGQVIEEIPGNLVDDNLDGLIDENNGVVLGGGPDAITMYQNLGLKYINYFTGEGLDNSLIDESPDDGIDNDHDWNALTDDVGQDGAAWTGDVGEGDGLPTPGEPNFERRDIDETDLLGLTSANLFNWEDIPLSDDELIWQNLIPGYYNDLLQNENIELFIGSGYFSLLPEQYQRVWMGFICANDLEGLLDTKSNAAIACKQDFILPQAPLTPVLTAIPGDKQVTLLWDGIAEQSYDPVLGYDFEGYRIYRSTTPSFDQSNPLAQFDLVNEYSGYAPVLVNGEQFYLGKNSGLVHEYVDITVQNGYTYYYAITAYDHGSQEYEIPPMECPVYLVIDEDGTVNRGKNVASCMPKNGGGKFDQARHVRGEATGTVRTMIVDQNLVMVGHCYRVTFRDSVLFDGNKQTKDFTLTNLTTGTILFENMPLLDPAALQPLYYVTEGFYFSFENVNEFNVDVSKSGWNNDLIYDYSFRVFRYARELGYPEPADYRIEFGQVGIDTSEFFQLGASELDAIPVNFRVTNLITGLSVPFAFRNRDGDDGYFTAFTDRNRADEIIFLDDSLHATWVFKLVRGDNDEFKRNPESGDIINLYLYKPFTSDDLFEMTMPQDFDRVDEKKELAVSFALLQNYPNPFNPVTTIDYTLPQQAGVTLEIYNVLGQKIKSFTNPMLEPGEHHFVWDGKSDLGLPVAGGIYIYRITAQSKERSFIAVKKMVLLK